MRDARLGFETDMVMGIRYVVGLLIPRTCLVLIHSCPIPLARRASDHVWPRGPGAPQVGAVGVGGDAVKASPCRLSLMSLHEGDIRGTLAPKSGTETIHGQAL